MMVLPALVAVLFMVINREPFVEVGWGLKRAWLPPVAFVVPILVTLLALGLPSLAGWASWSNEVLRFGQGQVDVRTVTLTLGKGTQSIGFFALNLIPLVLIAAWAVVGAICVPSIRTLSEQIP